MIRLHWGVENGLHWTLDGTFSEHAGRVRTGHAPQNLALLRRIALNALNLEQSLKCSNRQKSNRAAMDNNYMLTVLTACLSQHDDTSQPACQYNLRCAYPGMITSNRKAIRQNCCSNFEKSSSSKRRG